MQDVREVTNTRLMDTGVLLIQERNARLEPIAQFVRSNPHQRLTLKQAADIVGLERTYLSKLFHVSTGLTFSAWNRAVRIKMATVLLRSPRKSIRTIALSVGYPDLTTFSRAFKACVGVSPRVYRNSWYHLQRLRCHQALARNAER